MKDKLAALRRIDLEAEGAVLNGSGQPEVRQAPTAGEGGDHQRRHREPPPASYGLSHLARRTLVDCPREHRLQIPRRLKSLLRILGQRTTNHPLYGSCCPRQ